MSDFFRRDRPSAEPSAVTHGTSESIAARNGSVGPPPVGAPSVSASAPSAPPPAPPPSAAPEPSAAEPAVAAAVPEPEPAAVEPVGPPALALVPPPPAPPAAAPDEKRAVVAVAEPAAPRPTLRPLPLPDHVRPRLQEQQTDDPEQEQPKEALDGPVEEVAVLRPEEVLALRPLESSPGRSVDEAADLNVAPPVKIEGVATPAEMLGLLRQAEQVEPPDERQRAA